MISASATAVSEPAIGVSAPKVGEGKPPAVLWKAPSGSHVAEPKKWSSPMCTNPGQALMVRNVTTRPTTTRLRPAAVPNPTREILSARSRRRHPGDAGPIAAGTLVTGREDYWSTAASRVVVLSGR